MRDNAHRDRVVVLDYGAKIAEGSPAQVINDEKSFRPTSVKNTMLKRRNIQLSTVTSL